MNDEIHLTNRKKKGILRILFSRTGVVILLLVLAILLVLLLLSFFSQIISYTLVGALIFNLAVVIALYNSEMDSSAKLTWILLISVTSVFGGIFYLYTKINAGHRMVGARYHQLAQEHRKEITQEEGVMERLREESPETAELVTYLNRETTFPVTDQNRVTYYPVGEEKWADMLEELKKAERFIFLEYFIVEEGMMWGKILHILAEKVKQGVDVRVMYDGTCAISMLPYNYPELLKKLGIKAKMFSPLRPFSSTHYNNRDHRKILVIDGKVGFNGGVNLGDEYINHIDRFGHWKDTAVKIEGEAVKNLTLMFLNMWSFEEKNPDYQTYLNVESEHFPDQKGFVIPYGFNPYEKDRIGEKVYMDILNRANNYVHIMTPYLILDDELLTALKYSAERGVDTKLILPGIPDKKAVYALAKTYFKTLVDSGVKIYLYTPGFVHAKVFVSDDVKAVVGTINLDYRSLYHHFECGTYLYGTPCIQNIEEDFENTLQKCIQVTPESIKAEKAGVKIQGRLLRLIGTLL